jgi:Methyltransferase domain
VHGPGSRNKLSPSHARYYPDDGLLDTLGRAICAVDCLPRKELHEAWEMATRIRTWLAGDAVVRVVDLCAGYGLLAQVLLLQDNDPRATALAVDVRPAKNYVLVHDAVVAAFPNLAGRVTFERARIEDVTLGSSDVIVSAHACGALSDTVLSRATALGARVALMPCCHRTRWRADLVGLADPAAMIDEERTMWLVERGYDVFVDAIPANVSAKNRLLLGRPRS